MHGREPGTTGPSMDQPGFRRRSVGDHDTGPWTLAAFDRDTRSGLQWQWTDAIDVEQRAGDERRSRREDEGLAYRVARDWRTVGASSEAIVTVELPDDGVECASLRL